jgi:hypothetical protein
MSVLLLHLQTQSLLHSSSKVNQWKSSQCVPDQRLLALTKSTCLLYLIAGHICDKADNLIETHLILSHRHLFLLIVMQVYLHRWGVGALYSCQRWWTEGDAAAKPGAGKQR